MSTVTIRGLSDETHENLRQLAASNNRSMEAEAREALDQYCGVPGVSWAVVNSQVTPSPRFAGLISGLLALFASAGLTAQANVNKASKPTITPAKSQHTTMKADSTYTKAYS